ncbi:sporulation membrane protein YtaF [Cohnella faecalis]|uniref:Sporulation membrane protein YtaF n=1 Tax=Cohnella faecalis TaxID=2315694 RepID=A0A398CQ76_9BACL|nr:sporulation membrane protein YtaF [Cohnella faecalis]RIE02918.1 sporulation membrane protein YtaF [Cohnella faecalis]
MFAHLASLLILSFAVSLDGFGVGITYGVRKIRIPAGSIVIISACSGLIILLSMLAGAAMSGWMSPHGASIVGAVILIGIGGWALSQFFRNREDEDGDKTTSDAEERHRPAKPAETQRPVITLELKLFGIIIQILRKPSAADVDRSGIISAGEAFLLGTALSLDAFGAGIGAGLVGFPPNLTAVLIAAASGTFLWLGTRVGFIAAGWSWVNRLTVLPGIILIAMGIFKLL